MDSKKKIKNIRRLEEKLNDLTYPALKKMSKNLGNNGYSKYRTKSLLIKFILKSNNHNVLSKQLGLDIAYKENKEIFFNHSEKLRLLCFSCLIIIGLIGYFFLGKLVSNDIYTNILLKGNTSFKVADWDQKDETSPLCGCVSEEIKHKGIVFNGKDFKIKNSPDPKMETNFVITSPLVGKINRDPGFTFDVIYFIIKMNSSFKKFEPLDFITNPESEKYEVCHIEKIKNNRFVSIYNKGEIQIYSLSNHPLASLIPLNGSKINVQKEFNKFTESAETISIEEEFFHKYELNEKGAYSKSSSINTVPMIDFLGPEVVVLVDNSASIMGDNGLPLGLRNENKLYHRLRTNDTGNLPLTLRNPCLVKENMIQGLIVNVPFSTRLSISPWNEKLDSLWRKESVKEIMRQVYKKTPDLQYDAILYTASNEPIGYRNKKGKVVTFDYNKIKLKNPPLLGIGSKGLLKIELENLLNEKQYTSLYNTMQAEKTTAIYFEEGTKAIGASGLEIKGNIISKAEKSELQNGFHSFKPTDQIEYFKNVEKITNRPNFNNEPKYFEEFDIGGSGLYFRFPPISSRNGILVHADIKKIKTDFSIGELKSGNIEVNLNSPSDVEINLESYENIETPYFVIPIDINDEIEGASLKIRGEGKIRINDEEVGEKLFDEYFVQYIGLFATLIGGLAVIIELLPKFLRRSLEKNRSLQD